MTYKEYEAVTRPYITIKPEGVLRKLLLDTEIPALCRKLRPHEIDVLMPLLRRVYDHTREIEEKVETINGLKHLRARLRRKGY